jgi:hypothetical protein
MLLKERSQAGQMLGPMSIGLFGNEQRGLHMSFGVASIALVLSAKALLVSSWKGKPQCIIEPCPMF